MLLECVFPGEAQRFAVSQVFLHISAERVGKFHSMKPVVSIVVLLMLRDVGDLLI